VARVGYDRVTLREIAEELSISKGTIVHHFGSKEQMLRELHTVYMRRRIAEAEALLAQIEDPVDQLAALFYQNFVALRDDREATVAFAREIVRFAREEMMADVRALRRQYRTLVHDTIVRGMESGAFRRGDANLTTLQFFGSFNWVWTWLRPDGAWSIDVIASSFLDTLLGGMTGQDRPGAALLFEGPIAELVSGVMAAQR
jgi:AcrR family transcriptional regulator